MGVPPLDLYMEQRKCAFERRLETSGLGELLERTGRQIATRLRPRHGRYCEPPPLRTSDWPPDAPLEEVLHQKWVARWRARQTPLGSVAAGLQEPARPTRKGKLAARPIYKGGRKSLTSALFQARTGCIGLRAFLHRMSVPGFESPRCPCGEDPQTV